jgi:formate hydrogenlyase subunit 6/NADH:ubiquinone oxidoreductase subunit I
MRFLSRLSRRQHGWLFGTVIAMVAIVATGWMLEPPVDSNLPEMTTEMTIRQIAADCYSCARCLNVCPEEAIDYGSVFVRLPQKDEPPGVSNVS